MSPTFPAKVVVARLVVMAVARAVAAEILGDPYSKKSLLPSIGDFPCLANFPKLSS
jgi:hypothetical protein